MGVPEQEYPFHNMTFSPDYSKAMLTFIGKAEPLILYRHGGHDQVTMGISETLGSQRLAVIGSDEKVELNFPLMIALQDFLEPAP